MNNEVPEKCGLIGVLLKQEHPRDILSVPQILATALHGLQHRGCDNAGIVVSSGTDIPYTIPLRTLRSVGSVSETFTVDNLSILADSQLGLGHTGSFSSRKNLLNLQNNSPKKSTVPCQPHILRTLSGEISLAMNGELPNAEALKLRVLTHGVGLSMGTHAEIIAQLLCYPHFGDNSPQIDWPARIKEVMTLCPLAYSLLILVHDRIYACRDSYGNRPLCLGLIQDASTTSKQDACTGYIAVSESSVLGVVNAKLFREVLPGEIVEISADGMRSVGLVHRPMGDSSAFCSFEYIYFARSDTMFEGQQVYSVRHRLGVQLASECPVEADLVAAVPENSTAAALGFAFKSEIPFTEVLTKNAYVGRTLDKLNTVSRDTAITRKFGVLDSNFVGLRVALIDDSIVCGDTIWTIAKLLKENGAKEVHVRIASPPIRHPCRMGINIPDADQLLANKIDVNNMEQELGVESVGYLSVEGLHSAIQESIKNKEVMNLGHCDACLTGKYPNKFEF